MWCAYPIGAAGTAAGEDWSIDISGNGFAALPPSHPAQPATLLDKVRELLVKTG